jgi:arsenate reductase
MTSFLIVGLVAAWVVGQAGVGRTVVFVCEHGSAKSVVAAAHFNRRAAELGLEVRAVSRGTAPDAELAPAAVAGLRQDGLAPVAAAPVALTAADLSAAERVVSFNELPRELSTASVERWEVPPVSTQYGASRDAMLPRIEELLESLQAE